MKHHVYCLKQAEGGSPFYVGYTHDTRTRSGSHKRKYGRDILFIVLHSFDTENEAKAKESELIQCYARLGPLLNVAGTKPSAKETLQERIEEKEERKRLRASLLAYKKAKRVARELDKIKALEQRKAVKSVDAISKAFVTLRGLLTGVPTPKETALQALETIRLAPGAMELANVYIKANII